MDFQFCIGCCWFRDRDMRVLAQMLRERRKSRESQVATINVELARPFSNSQRNDHVRTHRRHSS